MSDGRGSQSINTFASGVDRDRASTPPQPGLTAVSQVCGEVIVVGLRGILRADSAFVVREVMEDALDQAPAAIVLDLSDVTTQDDLGLWVLSAMAGQAERHQVSLMLVEPSRVRRQRLRRLGGRCLDIAETASCSVWPRAVAPCTGGRG